MIDLMDYFDMTRRTNLSIILNSDPARNILQGTGSGGLIQPDIPFEEVSFSACSPTIYHQTLYLR